MGVCFPPVVRDSWHAQGAEKVCGQQETERPRALVPTVEPQTVWKAASSDLSEVCDPRCAKTTDNFKVKNDLFQGSYSPRT